MPHYDKDNTQNICLDNFALRLFSVSWLDPDIPQDTAPIRAAEVKIYY